MVLNKNDVLFVRDEKGELVPETVKLVVNEDDEEQLKYKDEEISVIPFMRGEVRKLFARARKVKEDDDFDIDGEIISKYCIDPVIEKDEVKAIKPVMATMIVNTIFHYSGLDFNKPRKQAIIQAEDDFAKN